MPIVKRTTNPVSGGAAATPVDQEAPKGAVKRTATSLEDAFDSAKPGGGFMPVGRHRAFITGFELEEPNDKGHSAKVTYTGSDQSDNEEVHDKDLAQWYKLLDKDGSPGQGLGFLKRDLEILGYAEVKFSELEDTFAAIVTERPEVIINVKQNGQWTNAYLQGLAEGGE